MLGFVPLLWLEGVKQKADLRITMFQTLPRNKLFGRLVLICTLGAFAGIFLIPLNPVNSKLLKLAFLGCVFGAWLGFTILAWTRKPVRVLALVLPFLVAIPLALPGGEMNSDELRKDYLRRMTEFEDTKYFWGGESSRGIDCSGLPRRALRDALLAYGINHFNGHAFRQYVEQWWYDASAQALAAGYRNYTSPLEVTGTIQEMNYDTLVPGDLAVTTNGVHILAYVGNEQWIQADPGIGAVATLHGRKDDNTWFQAPVTMHRWQILEKNP
ncbi:MAG: NlpC/P60 family protein [Verrucomicrobiota bacterium]